MSAGGGGGVVEAGFVVRTGLSPVAVRAEGMAVLRELPEHRARIVEASSNAGSVRYDVLDLGGRLLLVLRVSWHELGGGERRVTLSTHGHLVVRRRLLGRRRGRGAVPGSAVAADFARRLRARLT